ncbi:reverse transcriptase domain-containing protein [Tanacetum coccineum]
MDDFSVFGNSFDTCLNNLDKMLQHCKDTHLVLNWEKCHFMVKDGFVLGHKVSSAGLEVDKAKIDIISKLPPFANIKDSPFEFDDECQKAFELLKEKLICAHVIVSPNWNLPFELMCDANDFAVGAVLGQKDGKNFHPIYFARKTLNPAQQKYTIIEKELMAVALRHLFKKQDAKPCLIRWIMLLQQFDIETKDRKGTENVVVDHLSRIENDESRNDKFANYLVGDIIPKGMTYQQKNKFFFDLKHYFWEEPYLFKKLLCRFRMPKALISDRGTHFYNKIMERTMKRYGVNHCFSTSYHPQTNGQVENTNRALKRILEKTVKDNPAIWSRKLDDALWAFRTAYKTPTGTTPYKLIYGKNCHLPFEIEHRAYWALKNCNPDLIAAGSLEDIPRLDTTKSNTYTLKNASFKKRSTIKLYVPKCVPHLPFVRRTYLQVKDSQHCINSAKEFHTVKETIHQKIQEFSTLNSLTSIILSLLDILRNYDPMDDEPMWAADHVVAPTPGSAITIPETANKFAIKALFDRLLREIQAFSQHENESLTDAWLRMKEMLQNCHGHNLSKGNIIKIFYHGLSEITQEVLNAVAGGILLYKTPNQAYQLLEDKVLLKLDWAKNKKTKSSLKKTVTFADEGSSNSDTEKIMARMDAMTLKMDA